MQPPEAQKEQKVARIIYTFEKKCNHPTEQWKLFPKSNAVTSAPSNRMHYFTFCISDSRLFTGNTVIRHYMSSVYPIFIALPQLNAGDYSRTLP